MVNSVLRRSIEVAQMRATARDIIMANKQRKGQKLLGIQSYFYTAEFNGLAPGLNTTVNTQTQGGSDFLAMYLMGAVYNTSTQQVIASPYVTLSLADNVVTLPMMNIPAYFASICGTGGFPLMLQDPRLYSATTIIQTTCYNLLTVPATTINFQVTYGGFRALYATTDN